MKVFDHMGKELFAKFGLPYPPQNHETCEKCELTACTLECARRNQRVRLFTGFDLANEPDQSAEVPYIAIPKAEYERLQAENARLRDEVVGLLAGCAAYLKVLTDLLDSIKKEVEKDGWCRLTLQQGHIDEIEKKVATFPGADLLKRLEKAEADRDANFRAYKDSEHDCRLYLHDCELLKHEVDELRGRLERAQVVVAAAQKVDTYEDFSEPWDSSVCEDPTEWNAARLELHEALTAYGGESLDNAT